MMLNIRKLFLVLSASAALTTLLFNFEFNFLESHFYDWRMSTGAQPTPDNQIVLITIDDKTTRKLNEFSPLPLDFHARFMEALEALEPRAVGYLVDMNHVNQSNPDLFRTEWGKRFVDAAWRMEALGTHVLLGTPYDVTGEVLPPYPLSALPHSIAVIHKDGNVFSEDKVTRRALVHLYENPVFHMELATRLGLTPPKKLPRGSYSIPEIDALYFFFRYHGDLSRTSYRKISFIDILEKKLEPAALRGKIALVGTLAKDDSGDFAYTPYSKNSFSNPKLALHANILDSMIHDDGILRAPKWLNWISTFIVISLVFLWVLILTPVYGVLATLFLTLAFILACQILFQKYGWWIRETQPLLGIFLTYYLAVPYRLIREYKKSWEYQRQNQLLRQVEELKTNFISLVTHDLKTPVARIQGLTEVLMRKFSDRSEELNSHQIQNTLRNIIDSTDELNRFISAVLELSKVESNRLQLKFESKDINPIISRAIEGFSTQARNRKIEIVADLEPLFPIRLDTSLISKVMNNLIDNAIKYSPEGGKVFLRSREIGDRIEVCVQDDGIGMSEEEIQNIFTKFYRAKNDVTTSTNGTGLGLYLTKFFIEAHQGQVEVTSEKGKGSIFKISLPIKKENVHVQSSCS